MGVNSRLGELQAHSLDVTVIADRPLDERVLRGIIETHKPAQVGYTLQVCAAADVRPGSPPDSLSDRIHNAADSDEPDETPTAIPSGEGV